MIALDAGEARERASCPDSEVPPFRLPPMSRECASSAGFRVIPICRGRSSGLIYDIPIGGAGQASTDGVCGWEVCTPAAEGSAGVHLSGGAGAALNDAYWYAMQLINVGWLIRRIGTAEEGGFFEAETPRRRVVSVDERSVSYTDPATQFAKSIAGLAAAGAAEDRDYLGELVRLLAQHAPLRRPASLTWCAWHIPGVPDSIQPIPKVRAAYWFAVTLTDDYGWDLADIGMPTAGRGFVADIPGETIAIYPASMPDDGTVASALARLLAGMSEAEVDVVAALVAWHSGVCYHDGPGH